MKERYKLFKEKYNQITDITYRIDNGQIFTPLYVADFMSRWVLHNACISSLPPTFLDPASGMGVFFHTLMEANKNKGYIYGFEKDYRLAEMSKELYSGFPNVFIRNEDYLLNWNSEEIESNLFDGIISNPPYLIYKKYDNKKYLSLFQDKMGIELSGFTNLAMLFLIKSMTELKKGGRMAYIVPTEFMNADYGITVKEVIMEYGLLRYVLLLDYKLFNVNTTSAILLFANDDNNYKNGVRFINVRNKEDLNSLSAANFKSTEINSDSHLKNNNTYPKSISVSYKELNPAQKWRFYYQKSNSSKYKNLVELSKYALVLRGIATGANDFFLFNKSKMKEFGLKKEYFLPCISRSSYIDGPFIYKNNYVELLAADKKVLLLNADKGLKDPALCDYLRYGEEKGYHKRYLTSRRNPWYKLEDKPPAPILVQVFNRKLLKIVINEAGLYNLTAFHCIYPKNDQNIKLLKAYFLTNTAVKIIEDNRREYSDGLNKFEPGDIKKGLIVNIDNISTADREKIELLFDKCQKSYLENRDLSLQGDKRKTLLMKNIIKETEEIFLKYLC